MRACRRALGLLLATVAACGGDDGGAGDGASTAGDATAGDDDGDGDGATATGDDGMSADSTGVGAGECGNGVVEGDEDCDDGDANSDTEPDACRTDCREAQCNDGVLDPRHGEECDDGGDNGGRPNQCRATCMLPSCGDGVQDMGEACDDGNPDWGDTCYECVDRYYFILNTPTGAPVSIVRTTRDGEPIAIVSGDAAYDGLRQLALAPAGVTLYGVQSSGTTQRVLAFDPVGGALTDEVDLAAALGYEPDAQAIVRASDGLLWVALTAMGSTRMVTVDPASLAVAEALDIGDVTVADMTADESGGIYITTGDTADSIVRVDIAGPGSSTFADGGDGLVGPIGIGFDAPRQLLWVANNPAGAPSPVLSGDLTGAFMQFSTAGTDVAPIDAMAIDFGGVVLATQRSLDRVVAVQFFDAVEPFFTDLLDEPTDIEILDMAAAG